MAAIGSPRKPIVDPRYATVKICRNSLIPLWGSGWSFWIRDYLKLCQSTIDGGQNGLFIEYEQRGFNCSDTGIRDASRRTRVFALCDLDRKSLFTRFTCVKRSGFLR